MKRTYIKPETELLDCELKGILCDSIKHGIDGEDITPSTPSTPPDGAREFDGDFDFDE